MNTTVYSEMTTSNVTAIKNVAKLSTLPIVYGALVEALGAENVSMVGNSSIAINTGLKDGVEVNCVIDIVAKDYFDRETKTKTFPAYNRQAAADEYAASLEKAAAKKAEKQKR